jgi:L-rhamnose mutarotase
MEENSMVIRLRIYHTREQNKDADKVFYELVKPVHEKHGARFIGRYMDETGKHFVMWEYESKEELHRIQNLVANDPQTIFNKESRLKSGLHAVEFDEYILESN